MKQITIASKILSAMLVITCIGFTACQKDMSGEKATSGVQSDAATVTRTVTEIPVAGWSFFVPMDCVSGTGEVLDLQEGTLVITSLVTVNGNRFTSTFQFHPRGITAIGETSGDLYHHAGDEEINSSGSFINGQSKQQIVDVFYWIGPGGDAAKSKFNIRFNVVTNSDGSVTASIDKMYSTCN